MLRLLDENDGASIEKEIWCGSFDG